MKVIDVLIVVDVVGALAQGLQTNVYLVDTNKYVGSGSEGQVELKTACKDGQTICWRVTAISPSNDVEIVGFTGQMINEKVCVPTKEGTGNDVYWQGIVEARGVTGSQQYSVVVTCDSKQMTFDPYLEVQKDA